ncbi:MAG TPA: right-handed parallel beta-helix repeat-containing protein [Thermoanaerobaculia bacterium]|jgi:parallel beta-helix repeat protein
MRSKMTAVVVALIATLAIASQAEAATLYVSTTGNDSGNGALSSPYRTITKAAQVAQPGDQVHVRGGVYYETVTIMSNGTASARIAFRSYPGETAVIDGSQGVADSNAVTFYQASYVDFSGFEVRNAKRIGICGWIANNIRVLGNTVHGSFRNGIYFGYDTAGSIYDITVDGNTVRNNVLENQGHTWSGGWANGIMVSQADRARITNNKVYQNDGEGIIYLLATNGVIEGNEVYDNYSVGIYLDNARLTTINRNFIYSTGNTRYFRNGHPAAGLGTANEQGYGTTLPLSDLTFTNNIVVNARWGFYYGAYDLGGGLRNVTVANNTFYQTTEAMIWVENDAHANSIVENNIFQQVGSGRGADVSGTGVTYRNNGWYGVSAGAAAGLGDVLANPSFTNPGGRTAADYKLRSTSPAANAAVTRALATDYFGGARVAPLDLGAHELTATAADTIAPSIPAGVRATAGGANGVTIVWTPSTDNTAVTGYTVLRNGVAVANTTAVTYTDTKMTPAVAYSYQVQAYDAAGNRSAVSATLMLAWNSANTSTPDTQKPTTPSTLTANTASSSAIQLDWRQSKDDVAVTGYHIYRNGTLVATATGTTYTDGGLQAGTTYSYHVMAIDAAGNESNASNVANATTNPSKRRASR